MFAINRRFIIATLIISLTAASALLITSRRVSADGEMMSVIVELKQEPAAAYAARVRKSGGAVSDADLLAYRAGLRAGQDEFLQALEASGVAATARSREIKDLDGASVGAVSLRYTLVYNGVALAVPASAVPAIEAMPQVKKVHPNSLLYPDLHKSVDYIRAPQVYGAVKELGPFDELREGYEGQGINIAVIDTGIDWTHPMFGGDPTPPRLGVQPATAALNTNKKVIYSLPFTDFGVADGFGHGTHVAATAAGYLAQAPGADGIPLTADDVRLHGVAPQARLMSYKVCSDSRSTYGSLLRPQLVALVPALNGVLPVVGGCETADILAAIEDAVSPFAQVYDVSTPFPKPVAHVINLSLGGSGGPDSPSAVACDNAALMGATVVASAGNSGRATATNPTGENTVGAPSAGRHVISVGATAHPGNSGTGYVAEVPGGRTGMTATMLTGSAAPPATMSNNYVYCGLADTPDQVPDSVRGRIALMVRGSTATVPVANQGTGAFANKVAQAAAKGAVAALVFNNVDGELTGVTVYASTIPVFGLSKSNGEYLKGIIGSEAFGAVSAKQVRVNRTQLGFTPSMGDFSSKGPVRGFGQVKPDVSAPGVSVLAAVPPASLLGALSASNYGAVSGTSMAAPHASGVAALLKQAHPDWTPDMIRTAMINTSTNLRDINGAPKADGLLADRVISQGGGLVDVREALHAKALMGVANAAPESSSQPPAFLGSHSFGEVPVANSRVTHSAPVTVTIRDLSGQGGTYNLGVANSRDLQLAGVAVALSETSVSVPPGGSATFTVTASFDGDLLRDVMAAKAGGSSVTVERIQMQWYVTAERGDNAESLRMPFYFRPGFSIPAQLTTETTTATAVVPAGDVGNKLASGVTYVDVPFDVSNTTFNLAVNVEWLEAETPQGGLPDVDYQLLDPAGNVVASSGAFGGPEFVSLRVNKPGTYKHRLVGYANAATICTITTTFTRGGTPPTLAALAGDFRDAAGKQIDFDGALTLSWQGGTGQEQGYEIDRSADGANWQQIATAAGGQTSLALPDQPEGENFYRVRALIPGQIGFYVTLPSNVSSIVVSRRTAADVTSFVRGVNKSVVFSAGFAEISQALKNVSSGTTVYPTAAFEVTSVSSSSGLVRVTNADNAGDGRTSAAIFDYSNQLPGGDLAAGEESGVRLLRFANPNTELFTFTAVVRAHLRNTAGGGAAGTSAATSTGGGDTSGGTQGSGPAVLTFTVNPLTRTVSLVQ